MRIQYKSILMGLALTGVGLAPAFGDEHPGCDQINWRPQILAGFEDIDRACQEVVVRDDKRYVRFEVKLLRVMNDGNVKVSMPLADGTRVERVFHAPSDFHVLSHSGKTSFHLEQLSRGDILDVYIPESRIVAAELGESSG